MLLPRLYVERIVGVDERGARAYLDPRRSGIQFWDALRLTTHLLIGPEPRRERDPRQLVWAIVDTGAPLTLFPERVWARLAPSFIEFVSSPPESVPPPLSVAGTRCPYRLGWIWLGVRDIEQPFARLPAQRVLAQFAEDNGRLRQNVLVGLAHSVLAGRRLVRETTLEIDEPEPADPARRRPTFGQVWRLTVG